MLTKTHSTSKPSQSRQTKQQQLANSISSSANANQQQAPSTMAGQRQHEALASLFRSLSSLASGSQHQQQMDQLANCQPAGASRGGPLGSGLTPASLTSSSPGGSSIACSLQSAIAAAVMQQQLTSVTSAIGGQQQQQLTPLVAPLQGPISASHRGSAASSNSLTAAYHHLSEQMMPVNYSFLEQHGQPPPQVAATNPLEQDVQFPAGQTTTNLIHHQLDQNQNQQQQQQPNQRINYCTICNKELCNKYFMKTHMLKMHGISLEMEQQSTGGDSGQRSEGSPPDQSSVSGETQPAQEGATDRNQSAGNSSMDTNWATSSQAEQQTSKGHKQAQKTPAGKQSAGKQSNKTKGSPNSTQATSANSNTKPTTSVMNGFAGNSMGGVVCDICNKELCSKYFLKVHKQNTHGIMTDYQDAGQFVYPFVSHLAGQVPNGFMGAGMPPAGVLPFPSICFNQQSNPMGQSGGDSTTGGTYGDPVGPTGPKRARGEGHQSKQRDPNKSRAPLSCGSELASTETNTGDKPLDPFYKLMIAQQQQQQQPQLPLQPNFDPINQISALMCYGAMGPFGPAGLSPTMVVEMILRNQHLFNRNTNKQQRQQSAPQQGRATDKDRQRNRNNNGDSKQQKPGGAKSSSKEANNSRYFTHYTEACPMCDRRFKSIKWLKTHMMNDHKQEIGAYMQMMMQSMCPTKSQAAGNEHLQQQHHQNFHQQQQQQHQFPLEPPGPCYPMAFNSCGPQPQQHQKQPYQPAPISLCASNSQPAFSPALAQPLQPPPPPPTSQLGLVAPMQEDQFSLIQGYLDQQRQVLQQQHNHHHQGVMNLSSPESSHNRLATLTSLNAATRDTTSSSSSSSPASFAKTSPRSMTSVLNDHHHHQLQVDQLDLSIKYNPDSQSCPLECGVDFLQTRGPGGAHLGAHQISDFSEDEDDDCSSTSSSLRRPHNKPNEPEHFSEANASQSV